MSGTALDRLAARLGILARYHQVDGTERVAGPETKRALIRAMGLPAETDGDAEDLLARLDAEDGARRLPREIVVEAGVPGAAPVPPGASLSLESGETMPLGDVLPPLPSGLHRLVLDGEHALLIAAPRSAPTVEDLTGQAKIWGVTAALYGLRSARNLGFGDYEDLARLTEVLAPHGAAFLGINPVHARGVADRGLSPYSPSSRSAFAEEHLALDRIPGFATCDAAAAILAAGKAQIEATRDAPFSDRALRDGLAEPALHMLFQAFEATPGTGDRHAFEVWRSARPPGEARQSVYEAISRDHGPDWRRWPAPLQDPSSPETDAFAAANAGAVRYHDWCQWLADGQLAEAQRRARDAGMSLGLYLDIAVGVRPGGAETWAERSAFAAGASLGAPPDLLNSEGQTWDLAPFSPIGLAARDYGPFRAMLAKAMGHAGIVRIDHVIGFQQSFWAPDCGAPGGYVRFPLETLMALTRIEAARTRCLVIGEDLGTVPEGLRAALGASGLHGCAIMPFEREPAGFVAPDRYRPMTLASFGTHDLPTLAGWWAGRDITIRADLGHLSAEGAVAAVEDRARDRALFCHLMRWFGLLPPGIDPESPPEQADAALIDAMHALLATSASALTAVQLDDIFGETEPQNVPGTVTEQPNWRRRMACLIEELGARPELARAAAAMAPRRPAPE